MRLVTNRKHRQIKPRHIAPVSKNTELHALSNLYTKIAKEIPSSKLIAKISKRIRTTRTNQHPVKIPQLIEEYSNKNDTTAPHVLCVVAKVLDCDTAVLLPAMTVVCLKISRTAKEKIERFGGKVFKLDELFSVAGDLSGVKLVMGDVTKRKVYKYHGGPGAPGSKALPKIITKQKDVTKRPS